jgi:hypothetical protein
VGRGRGRRRGSQGRAEGRVRGRVRERVQGRSPTRGEASTGRSRGAFDVGAIEGYANRLRGGLGGTPGLSGAASGLAGAASGLAGGSLAHRLTGGGTEGAEEDLVKEVTERLDLMEERLALLEDEVRQLREGGDPGDVADPSGEPSAEGDQ